MMPSSERLTVSDQATDASPKIGVFVVTYNASKTIAKVLERIPPEEWERITEVFIFDDCSQDETATAAVESRPESYRDKVRVFFNRVNLGYGGNQKRGYAYARARGLDLVVLLHGDGQYAPEVIGRLIDPLVHGEADAVFGSRMMEPGLAREGGMPLYKYVGNKVLTRFQNLILGRQMTEYHSGYRAYRVETLNSLPLRLDANDFHFDNEIIIQLHEAGARILEVPIPTYYGDEICHVNGMKYAKDVFLANLRYRLHKLGLLYAKNYDLRRGAKYSFKPGRYSSHNRILAASAAARPRATLLDVGCGAGLLAQRFAAQGYEVSGVDVYDSAEAREHCASFRVRDLDAGLGLSEDERFEVIVFADVLEHLRDPEGLLMEARRHLSEGGQIIASTGNVANIYIRLSLLFGRFDYTERGILDRTHCRLFTRRTFETLIRDCGFEVEARVSSPIPFENIFVNAPRLAALVNALYMLFVWIWPSLFAYQTILTARRSERATELLRESEIHRADFPEWSAELSESQAAST